MTSNFMKKLVFWNISEILITPAPAPAPAPVPAYLAKTGAGSGSGQNPYSGRSIVLLLLLVEEDGLWEPSQFSLFPERSAPKFCM